MKGYRDEDGFHLVLDWKEDETVNLGILVSKGVQWIKEKWVTLEEPLRSQCIKDAELLEKKIDIIFIAENYRNGGASLENPIIVTNEILSKEH